MQGLPLFAARRRSILLYFFAVAIPVAIFGTLLSQRVFAQNTFVITDGDQVIVHTTYASDPALALDEAGVDADPDEYVATQTEEGVYDITVTRNDAVTVVSGGEEMVILIRDATVGELLKRAGVPTGEDYVVSCDLQAVPVDKMVITVDHVVTNEEVYTVEVPYETSRISDPYLPEGEERIISEGVVGQVLYTARVQYRNAEETDREIVSKETLQEVQNQIVGVGTGELTGQQQEEPLIGDGVIVLPSGEVLTYHKKDTFQATAYTHMDAGCDFYTATGTRVHWGTVAVDPRVIPYKTRMFIVTPNGKYVYGVGTAEDCGGAIKGNRLDLYMPTLSQAFAFGRRDVTVYFLS